MILTIILGIIGLGIVVFVHELGHFVVAKASGITVEAFSLGWGKVLYHRTWRGTDYRISLLPIGGYCKMKGEELFRKAVADDASQIPHEEGSLFSVSVWKRMLTYAAGPFFNLLFAILVLSLIWFNGFSINTYENKIVLLSDYPSLFSDTSYPADQAGLRTGDEIVSIDGEQVETYTDIQQKIAPSPRETLSITVERNDRRITLSITPELNRDTGAGRIGVAAWIAPIIGQVKDGSSAQNAGLRAGDRLVEVNGTPVPHSLALHAAMSNQSSKLDITFQRNGTNRSTELIPFYDENGNADLGIAFRGITHSSPQMNPFQALARGTKETFRTFALTIKGIALLFSGVDVQKAVSGPVRITYMVGEIATAGFTQGIGSGFINLFRFLSLLSVALAFGNLLPIPALDGGLIALSVVEAVKGSSVKPKTFYRYQTIGFVFILLILFLTTFSDLSYLFSQ
ncbi:MAG: RIP metalloprotease RseP [Spirochaetia bacterium]|nr:RIP metalloprotease RseP [Spirochaetia bacterium]